MDNTLEELIKQRDELVDEYEELRERGKTIKLNVEEVERMKIVSIKINDISKKIEELQ
jgi:CRISPR/Cas system-associated endonuclease Cas3-HD